MRAVLLLSTLLWSVSASAADTVWVTEDTASQRFADSDTTGPTFSAFSRLKVLYTEGDRIRVKEANGTQFGWVLASATTEEEPPEAQAGALGEIPDIEELMKQFKLPE